MAQVRKAARNAWAVTLGGTPSLLTAAAHGELPIRSITVVGTPIDYSKLPSLAALRAVERRIGGWFGSTVNRMAGGVPSPLVQAGFRLSAPTRTLTKPLYVPAVRPSMRLVEVDPPAGIYGVKWSW